MAEKPDQEELELVSKLDQLGLGDDLIEISLEMLTWNTNCSKQESHTAALRDTLISIFQQSLEHRNCISFFQEIKISVPRMKEKWNFPNVVLSSINRGTTEAGLSTPSSGRGKQTTIEPGERLDEIKLEELGVRDEEFRKRMCAQMITVKHKIGQSEYIGMITVVSYHAQYRSATEVTRCANMIEYFKTMCHVADTLQQTIIVGGDFNLPILYWKDKVEKQFPNRVSVAMYVATPRRWKCDNLIDTFAIVQPSLSEHQTKATVEETMAIYPFPMAGYVGGEEKSALKDYLVSCDSRWFKYLHYSHKDLKIVREALEKKGESDLSSSIPRKIEKEKEKLKNECLGKEEKRKIQNKIDKLERQKEQINDGSWLSEPFTKIENPPGHGPPAPLWPNSSLHEVLDHDPVMTKIKITLKQNNSAQDSTPATPVRRHTRSTK